MNFTCINKWPLNEEYKFENNFEATHKNILLEMVLDFRPKQYTPLHRAYLKVRFDDSRISFQILLTKY